MYNLWGPVGSRSQQCKSKINNSTRYIEKAINGSDNVNEILITGGYISKSLKDLIGESIEIVGIDNCLKYVEGLNSGLSSQLSDINKKVSSISVSTEKDGCL